MSGNVSLSSPRKDRIATAAVAPRHARSGGEGSGVGGASANSLPESKMVDPPPPTPPPRAKSAWEEGADTASRSRRMMPCARYSFISRSLRIEGTGNTPDEFAPWLVRFHLIFLCFNLFY